MKMNEKGQVLVLFVIIMPIIILTLIVMIDLGKIYIEKSKTKEIIKDTIEYGLKNYDETINEKINNLIDININKISDKTIFVTEDEIRINITQEGYKIFGKKIKLEYKYIGKKEQEKITIEEG